MTPLRDGRYAIVGRLGEGTQGATYEAVDKREGRAVAVKRFDVRGAKAWKDVELAEREARVLASLEHPKLPRYVEHFEDDGALYLVMEKIEGESLGALRKRGAVLGEEDVVRLLRDADEVLRYLHARAPAVIHRDLKPSNVIRRPDGSYAFVDFGAVRDRMKVEGGSTVVGTFGYMAPEQFQGRALPGSDVYAIGATALTMLTGTQPEDLPHRGLALDVDAALKGRASKGLVAVLRQMLDPDPDRRPSSIGPLLRELDRREASRAEPVPPPRPSKKASKREAREARREERRARRRGRRANLPWFLTLFAVLGITVGIVAVSLATQVVVPLVLTLLSILFGKPLRDAAEATRRGGRVAVDAMHRARDVVQRGLGPEANHAPAVRVATMTPEAPRTRIADDAPEVAHEEADEEEEEARGRRRK